MDITQLEEATEMAYSFDRYSRGGWRQCLRLLRTIGLNDKEIQAVMRSKHLRWAGDMDDQRPYGRHNSTTLKNYLQRYPLNERELEKLVAGTF